MSGGNEQRCILIVDDEPGILDSLQMLFELEGYDVLIASNGAEALDRLNCRRPDLVLTDYMMPNVNGYEMARAIRQDADTRDLPIVMMTAVSMPLEEVAPWVDTVLTKPITIDQVLEVIAELLERQSASW